MFGITYKIVKGINEEERNLESLNLPTFFIINSSPTPAIKHTTDIEKAIF